MTSPMVVVVLLSLVFPVLAAQRGGGSPLWDLSRETTIAAKVEALKTFAGPGGRQFIYVTLQRKDDPAVVLIGREDWVKKEAAALKAGAVIEFTGPVGGMRFEGKPAMIVRTMKMGRKSVTVRDKTGQPVWLRK